MSLQLDPEPEAHYTLPSPPDLDAVTYLYGHPLLNSLSPLLHKTIYNHLNLNWAQIPLSTTSSPASSNPTGAQQQQQQQPYTLSPPIPTFLSCARTSPKFTGSSVTMPHKVSIIPYLDDLTDEARGVGACNTIFLRSDPSESGRHLLVGTNTDCIGIREALLRHSPTLATTTMTSGSPSSHSPSTTALIVGGGGTARAAIYALTKYLNFSTIYIVNRDDSEVQAMIAEYEARTTSSTTTTPTTLHHITSPSLIPSLPTQPSIIISGIPNYPPITPPEILAREVLDTFLSQPPQNQTADKPRLLLEMCYHPHPWTSIAETGDRAGWTVILGTEAMVWQGLEQARLWTGRDDITTDKVLEAKVKSMIEKSLKERSR
ncbi:hypothetical protein FQN54_002006 [Arachnomyces sp. PD_36]|nr:hypothetical protein FQN54_002006 [Arachnomyces sp. PD_36]